MGCGCGKTAQQKDVSHIMAAPILEAKYGDIFMQEDFLPAIYRGPDYTHIIPSRTGIITKYNLKNYGFGKNGTRISVHKDDAKAYPTLYEVIKEKPTKVQKASVTKIEEVEPNDVKVVMDEEVLEKEEELIVDPLASIKTSTRGKKK